jgi:ABC-type nickel/cobalt efflux system permease component RcnA
VATLRSCGQALKRRFLGHCPSTTIMTISISTTTRHGDASGCGHLHVPRPGVCARAGNVLVGGAATFAMALGTAIMVSVLAILAVRAATLASSPMRNPSEK